MRRQPLWSALFAALLAALFISAPSRPRAETNPEKKWQTYREKDSEDKDAKELLAAWLAATPAAGPAFELLRNWETFQKADKVSFQTLDGKPPILQVFILRGAEKWVYCPPAEGNPDGTLVRLDAGPDGSRTMPMSALKKGADGTVSATPTLSDEQYPRRVLADASAAKTDPGTVFDGGKTRGSDPVAVPGGAPSSPRSNGLIVPSPESLNIAARGASAEERKKFDYYWSGNKVMRTSDDSEFGYRPEGTDAVFYHGGLKPSADGTHEYQGLVWALYNKNGQKLGSYGELDLLKDNVVTVGEGAQKMRRIDLSKSVTQFTEYASADKPLGSRAGFQFQKTTQEGGLTLRRYVDLESSTYQDRVETIAGEKVVRTYKANAAVARREPPPPASPASGSSPSGTPPPIRRVLPPLRPAPPPRQPGLDAKVYQDALKSLQNPKGKTQARLIASQLLAAEALRTNPANPAEHKKRQQEIVSAFGKLLGSKGTPPEVASVMGNTVKALKPPAANGSSRQK